MSKKTCALIGYGNIGHEWAAALKHHPDWELAAIVDANTELLDSIPNMGIGLGENEVFPTIKECVNSGLKPDLAIVAIPPYFHHTVTKEVMDLDINVICEKNMALTLSQGRQMVQLAKSKPNLCTAVDTQYRYQIPYWTAHEFLKQENCPIGKLGMIKWESTDARIDVLKPWWHALPDIYLSDMSIHWFDLLRYTTGLDIVQVKADVFTPNYSQFQGSSDVSASLALAKLKDYNNRQNWVWCQFYGGFQRNGPTSNEYVYYGEDGQAKIGKYGMELKLYSDKHDKTKFEEDGYLPSDAGPVMGTPYQGHDMQLELMSKAIDSGGEIQPPTNFREAFKSFAVTMACVESSQYGHTVWVPDYWKGLID